MVVIKIIASIAIALISWPILNLLRNYFKARKIGLPIVLNPIDIINPVWIITQKRLIPLFKALPFGLGNWVVYSGFGSMFSNRYRLHAKHGPAFLVVTPKEINLYIGDAEVVEDILSKRKDLIKAEEAGTALNLFGTNVVTLNGEDWARHRRITTPPFNERNSNNIWKESIYQATGSK
jgi:hypothetical protein